MTRSRTAGKSGASVKSHPSSGAFPKPSAPQTPLRLLIVSYVDDNFGDNLIRICFEQLLRVVLQNLGLTSGAVELQTMPLKEIDEKLVTGADIIAFAGGGLFGLSYLGFYEWLDRITALAEQHDIPVFFSSMGKNNMDGSSENEHLLRELFQRKCIKALSVREDLPFFEKYTAGCGYTVELVCDPAVWTAPVYHLSLSHAAQNKTVGINVVRGGLFADNGVNWKLSDELRYLDGLRKALDARGADYVLYTNGSFLDNNTLRFFADQYDIPAKRLAVPETTSEWVRTVAGLHRVAAIRMHSSIVAYSLGIPAVNLVWNAKIPLFYQNIGRPERAVAPVEWSAATVDEWLQRTDIDAQSAAPDRRYMMTLYAYLYRVMNELTGTRAPLENQYNYDGVVRALTAMSPSPRQDEDDLRLKIAKSEYHYLNRFKELRQVNAELERKSKELERTSRKLEKLRHKLHLLSFLPSVFLARLIAKGLRYCKKHFGKS